MQLLRNINYLSTGCLAALLLIASGCKKDADTLHTNSWNREDVPVTDTISGTITTNTLLTSAHPWYIKGWVYVANEATLRMEAGTIVRLLPENEHRSGGIVITRGAKIAANGTTAFPVDLLFHTGVAAGSGIIILGRAPQKKAINVLDDPDGSGSLSYGGDQAMDSSGVLQHIRLTYDKSMQENAVFKGGLLLLGTGNKTELRDVMLKPLPAKTDTFNRQNLH